MKHICTLLHILLFFGAVTTTRGQRIVKGTVHEASKHAESLPGVTVLIKGTKAGTTTDQQGNFRLVIPHDTVTLLFSFVGFMPLEKRITATPDTLLLISVALKESCNIDLFYTKHVEIAFLSGLHYTPLGGKIKVSYPYLIHARNSAGSLRAEFSYQTGDAAYQRNAALALDELFLNCDNDLSVTTDYQEINISGQQFMYRRYSVGLTYAGKLTGKIWPLYVAVGRLNYSANFETGAKTGVELGTQYYLVPRLDMVATARVAWWQKYWQFCAGINARYRRFTASVNFNKLGQYAEINTGIGFRIEKRYSAKR